MNAGLCVSCNSVNPLLNSCVGAAKLELPNSVSALSEHFCPSTHSPPPFSMITHVLCVENPSIAEDAISASDFFTNLSPDPAKFL